jgi:LysM repeat protein
MYYCKDNNVNYYKEVRHLQLEVYQNYKKIDYWQISMEMLSYLFSTLLLALFLIVGYLYLTKQNSILSNQMRYVFSTNSQFYVTKYPTYMVKSQKTFLKKEEIARIDKILTNNNRRDSSINESINKSVYVHHVRTIVVKKGDTLYTLAEKAYGNASYYRLIFDANPKVLKSKKDLHIGQVLRIPF